MMNVATLAPIYLAIALFAQAPAGGQSSADAGANRLKFMKDSVRTYELTVNGENDGALKLQEEPVFRLGKQYGEGVEDGAIFLWTGASGRPEAAIQLFRIKNSAEPKGLWIYEFTSLATAGLKAQRNGQLWWSPTMPGLEFKPVPGAPKPGESAPERARQRRTLADGFRASDDFGGKGWSELRLLPTPIARYADSKTKLLDGSLLAFVMGTDPEVFLFLAVRPGREGSEWQYALAPMTVFAVKASYRGKVVWELPDRHPSWNPSQPFFDRAEGR
jgi:hypothetical protein